MDDDLSGSDDDLGMRRKALQVELPDDFDPDIVPQNGEEYVRLVMYEAKRCKQLVVADIDCNKLKRQTYKVHVKGKCKKAPLSMLPTLEWQEQQVADFTKFRKFVATKITAEPSREDISDSQWAGMSKLTPTLTAIGDLTQRCKIRVLNIITDELNAMPTGSSISYEVGVWIYSILATLEIPLCPDSCSCIRELARECSKVRAGLPDGCDDKLYTPLNFAICVIARYFKQLDLADDENDV